MTPYELLVLIHHYGSPGPFPQHETKLYKDTTTRFVCDGIFWECPEKENGFDLTDLGKAWLFAILKTPVPKLAYVDAEGHVIKVDL